ncbi:MAG: TIGR03085 family metal-binding protein [Streptosporangiaceae bacterium]
MKAARTERLLLADLLTELGPAAPTRCEGWTTADLAAHLVVREYRPDTAPGLLIPALHGHSEKVRLNARDTSGFERLVERIRNGPPKYSPLALPGVEEKVNLIEYFVHHEDVRRARPDWEPRTLTPALEDLLWQRLGAARLMLRKLAVGVSLVAPDGRRRTVTKGSGSVSVHGPASELALWVAGRTDVARVRLEGEPAAVRTLTESNWSV